MQSMLQIAQEAISQIPLQRRLRDDDHEIIQRHHQELLALGPAVAQSFEEVLYSQLTSGAGMPRESLERWWRRTIDGPLGDDYFSRMAFTGLVHVTQGVTNPMMLAMSDHVVQLVADAAASFQPSDAERRELLAAVGRGRGHRPRGRRLELRAGRQRRALRGGGHTRGAADPPARPGGHRRAREGSR